MVGEAVDAVVGTPLRLAVDLVEALEQPAVEERDGAHQFEEPLWVGEQVFVAVEVGDPVMWVASCGVAPAEAALVLLLVQRGEEEVLQDGFVEAGLLAGCERFVAFEQGCQFPFVEQRVGDEPLGFEEPAEQQARDETDEALLDVGVAVVNFGGHRELHLRCCPEEPVGNLLVELAREAFDIEGAVEAVGDFGNRGLPVQEFLQAEVQFGEPFEGGACGRAEGVGQRAQFGFAVGSLARPCERHAVVGVALPRRPHSRAGVRRRWARGRVARRAAR
jgi:hypothetical protein